jgi:anti-anti-sigma factor
MADRAEMNEVFEMAEEADTRRIVTETIGQTLVMRLRAKMMDDKDLALLGELIEPAGPSTGAKVIVLDMSRVQILSSLAMGILVELTEKCKRRHQNLKLAEVTPSAMQAIKVTHLDRVLHLSDTVDVAIE